MKNYVKAPETNLWIRPGFQGIPYTDGSDVEERLLASVSQTENLDALSETLADRIVDWPSEYHLSRNRHCLVRPLGIKADDRVLELGCGCGAITRFLGETGAYVVAVEGGAARAGIAAARCRGLANVNVVCEDLLSFSTDETFDWVLLVGVLEYAPVFSTAASPVLAYLEKAGNFLCPTGKLVVAIENQLGLKYFNGCTEDHEGDYFFGINDLYGSGSTITFGKNALKREIGRAGFEQIDFYYPYPDYKLPAIVLTDAAFRHPTFDAAALLMRSDSRDYIGKTCQLFCEPMVNTVLYRNGLLPDFANSFLAVATKRPCDTGKTRDFAWVYSVGKRKTTFCTETRFYDDNGAVGIKKTRLAKAAAVFGGDAQCPLNHRIDPGPYVTGRLAGWDVIKACLTDDTIEGLAASFHPWFKALLSEADTIVDRPADPLESRNLKGDMVDATPFNCMLGPAGATFFDREWCIQGRIPLGWVLYRSVLWSLTACLFRTKGEINVVEIMSRICRDHDLGWDDASVSSWAAMEKRFLSTVMVGQMDDVPVVIQKKVGGLTELSALISTVDIRDSQLRESTMALMVRDRMITDQAQAVLDRDRRIADQEQAILDRDQRIADQEQAILDRDRSITGQEQAILDRNRRIAGQEQAILDRDRRIADLAQVVSDRDQRISDQMQAIVERDVHIARQENIINEHAQRLAMIYRSTSWRLTRPLRNIAQLLKS